MSKSQRVQEAQVGEPGAQPATDAAPTDVPQPVADRAASAPAGPATALGGQLRSLRDLSRESLRVVAEKAGISAAYLLKLEQGGVAAPSPHVLRSLASHYGVSYLSMMQAAGYDISDAKPSTPRMSVLAQALAGQTLTETEERAITAFLSSLRSR